MPKALTRRTALAKPLQAWQVEFCEWLARRPKNPNQHLQVAKANSLIAHFTPAGEEPETVTYAYLRQMKRLAMWQDYYKALVRGGKKAAREKLEVAYPEYVDLHLWGAREARKAGDYGVIPKFTNPMLDRVEPKTQRGTGEGNAGVTINLTVNQAELLKTAGEAEPVDVEFEEITE